MLSVFRHSEDMVVISGELAIEMANVNDLLELVSVCHVECNAA